MQKLPGQLKKFPLGSAREKSRQEAFLEAQLRATRHLPGGRSLDCWIGNIASADRDNPRHAGASHPRNQWRESVRSQCAGKARSGNLAAFVAGCHRPRIEAES